MPLKPVILVAMNMSRMPTAMNGHPSFTMLSLVFGTVGRTTRLSVIAKSGIFYDEKKLHVLNHVGKHFSVRGPLNVARSPQGRPVVVQAGSSETGRELAALHGRSGVYGAAHACRRPGVLL